MTNAKKFKEVFGYDREPFTDGYHCPFNSDRCKENTCEDCLNKWWQSEYKEPKKEVSE